MHSHNIFIHGKIRKKLSGYPLLSGAMNIPFCRTCISCFLCRKYVVLNNKFTTYRQKIFKRILKFPGDSQKIVKLFLNGIFNIVGCHFV